MKIRSQAFLIIVVSLAAVCLTAFALSGQTKTDGSQFERTIGLALPSLGRIHYNDEGFINKMTGFNLGLGYSARFYRDGLVIEDFNTYWGWGTIALLLPYVEFGVSYPFEIGDKGNLLVLDLGLIYILPRIGLFLIY